MNDLIKISKYTINGAEINSVNLRDLHSELKSKRRFADYAKSRLGRFIVNEDYICISQKSEIGNKPKIEYFVTLDTAKMIAMMENNETGDEVRRYFIKIEKQQIKKLPTYLETAKMLVEALEEKETLLLTNRALEKQNTILMHTNNLYTATEIAKELNLTSATQLNKKLSEMNIQYKVNGSWVFYSKYANNGYTSIKQHILENGKAIYDRKFTQTGRDFILKLFSEDN